MTPRADPTWRLTVLGQWQLFCDGQRMHVTIRQQRVIAALAVLPARPRAMFSGLLWPEHPAVQAAGSLRAALWRIRHDLPGLLDGGEDPPRLSPAVSSDIAQFRLRTEHCDANDWACDPDFLVDLLDAELLPGWYDDWVCFEQDRLRQRKLTALRAYTEQRLRAGDAGPALEAARMTASIEPFSETTQTLLIRALISLGDVPAAAEQLHRFRLLLMDELGVEPSPGMVALVRQSPREGTRVATPAQ